MVSRKILTLSLGVSLLALSGCDSAQDREQKYLSKAQTYFDEANYEKMQVELKNVLQINPKNTDARYLSALVAEKDQDWRKMFGTLLAVVEAQPDHYEAQLKLAKLYLFSKDVEKASEKIELVLTAEAENPDAIALKATIQLMNKDIDGATALLNQALTVKPGHYDSSLLLISILGQQKKVDEIKQLLESALAVNPDKLKLSLLKIKLLLSENKKDEVNTLYPSLIQRFPENETLYYSFAKFSLAEKKIDQAEQTLKQLVAQLPEKDRPKFVLIDFLTRQRGLELAEKEIDLLINENPDNFGFRFAKLALYKDQPEKIQQNLEQIVEDDKLGAAGIDARNKLAVLHNSKGDEELARKLIEEVIELDPKNTTALLFRAGFLLKNKEFDAAIADARSILREEPESEKALLILAVGHLKTNSIELAQESLEKVLQINPKNLLAIKDLIRIKVAKEEYAEAITLLEKAHALYKDDKDISVMLVDLYGKDRQWEKAEAIAKGLLESSEAKELPHFKLAQLYMGQKKFSDAIVEFNKVLATNPKAADVIAGIVNAHLALKQEKKAEALLDNAIAENKGNAIFLTMRGELYRQQKQYADAERLFSRVIELKPQVELGYKNLATIYQMQKQLDKLINVFEQGVEAIPESGSFLMQLGILNTVAGDIEKAIDAYQKLLQVVPDNLLATNNLAALLVETADKQKIETANSLVSSLKDSEYPAFLDTYGWTRFKAGNVDEALIALESAVNKEGVTPEMNYHLALVYIEKGRVEEAKMELEKAVVEGAKFKGIEVAKSELKRLKEM